MFLSRKGQRDAARNGEIEESTLPCLKLGEQYCLASRKRFITSTQDSKKGKLSQASKNSNISLGSGTQLCGSNTERTQCVWVVVTIKTLGNSPHAPMMDAEKSV